MCIKFYIILYYVILFYIILYYFIFFYIFSYYFIFFHIILYFFRRAFLNRAKKAHRIENTTIVMLILLRSRVPLKIESGKRRIRKNVKNMKNIKNIKQYNILYMEFYIFILFYIMLYLICICYIILYFFSGGHFKVASRKSIS